MNVRYIGGSRDGLPGEVRYPTREIWVASFVNGHCYREVYERSGRVGAVFAYTFREAVKGKSEAELAAERLQAVLDAIGGDE